MSALRSRLIAFAVSLGLLSQMVPALAFAFTDVKTSTNYHTAIEALAAKGILQGYANGTFAPNATINRAEFLKIVLEARDGTSPSGSNCFPDVKAEWFAPYVCAAKTDGIVGGYPDGLFHPERNVTFVEAAKILSLAFKQQANEYGADWYVPFARALEGSNAIPTTIAKLDAPLKRGEMAEMMWRLIEGKMDQPSKGYLNVKYPEVKVNLGRDVVQKAMSCADLGAFSQESAGGQNMYYGRGALMEKSMDDAGAPAPMAPAVANQTASDGSYSQTNVQVEGVDEADIVKTDGTYLYIVRNTDKSTVRIVKAVPASDMREVATIDLQKENMSAQDLYLDGKRLVITGQHIQDYSYPYPMMEKRMATPGMSIMPYPYYTQKTDVKIYDITTPSSPSLLRTLSFEGSLISSRRIGTTMYAVFQQPMRFWGNPIPLSNVRETDVIPVYNDSQKGTADLPVAKCATVSILPRVPSPQYMTVAAIPLDSATAEVKNSVILGSAENVYASLQNMYVATTQWHYDWRPESVGGSQKTNLYRFSLTKNGAALEAQGSVPGRILNQFSMDENGSTGLTATFRIATTEDQTWGAGGTATHSSNNLFVLNQKLETVGSIRDIAPGESIYSTRFMGNRAYMVTFKQVDPLFVIDLTDARNPKILGKLKIPGYSNYLHPYDETHVIGFGKEVDESIDADKVHSDDAVYYTAIQGVKVSLFDVTDVANPKEMFKEVIGDRGSESAVLNDHKALLFDKDRGLLAFPILVTKRPAGSLASADGLPVFQGAYVYTLNLKDGFKLRGTVTHYPDTDSFAKAGDYWYGGANDVKRIVRIGSSLLTISDAGVKSNDEVTVKEQGKVTLK